eukprot:9502628-Lingulodinium_polyedra.AAC.1
MLVHAARGHRMDLNSQHALGGSTADQTELIKPCPPNANARGLEPHLPGARKHRSNPTARP